MRVHHSSRDHRGHALVGWLLLAGRSLGGCRSVVSCRCGPVRARLYGVWSCLSVPLAWCVAALLPSAPGRCSRARLVAHAWLVAPHCGAVVVEPGSAPALMDSAFELRLYVGGSWECVARYVDWLALPGTSFLCAAPHSPCAKTLALVVLFIATPSVP